jgi:DNA-binding XRE family transcriptional regulator
MRFSEEVQFIPATGQPEYAVIPYSVYLALKQGTESKPSYEAAISAPAGENPIKSWRKARGLSQGALAEQAEISVPYLSQLEHNVRVGSKAVLLRLAEALQVPLDQIV